MKFLSAILTIAVVIQVCLAVPLARSKRSNDFIKDFENMFEISKRLIPMTENVIKNSIPKIPNISAYDKYRQELQTYLAEIRESKSNPGSCYQKTYVLLVKFAGIWEKYEQVNAAPEAKSVKRIFNQNGGIELDRDFDDWAKAYDDTDFYRRSKTINATEVLKLKELIDGVC